MKRSTHLTLSLAAAFALFAPAHQLLAALVAQYNFDGNTNDSSGNGYNGTVSGTTSYGAGLYGGQSFNFDGSTNIATNATSGQLGLANNSFTVNSWVNFSDFGAPGNGRTIVGSGPGGTNEGLHLLIRDNKALLGFYANDTAGNQTLLTNQTYNLAFRYNQASGEQAVFINGRLDAASLGHAAFGGSGGTSPVVIGQSCCGAPPLGQIDQVQIYNTPISKGQLVEQYQTVSLAGAATPATGFIHDYLDSNTLDSLYYSVNNNTGNGGPPSVTAVGGTDGHVDLQSRGHLNTTGQFNPSATGVEITGRWSPANPGDTDFFQVLTRSDGVPNTGSYGETTNGVEFFKATGSSALSVTQHGGQFSVTNQIQTGTLNFVQGSAYDFAITDNGNQVTFRMTEVGNLANSATVTANVTPTGGHENTDFITFHNREGGPRNAYLEALNISSLTPTIGVLGDPANRGFTIRSVQDNSIVDLGTADTALANSTGVTTHTSVVNFLDGGGNGHYGGDLTPPITGDHYAIKATAELYVPAQAGGTYTFGTNNDDGVRLLIDGNAIITDNTGHAPADFLGLVNLTPGLHTLELVYFENVGGAALELFYARGALGAFDPNAFSLLNITAVPEPSSMMLLLLGAIGLGWARRKRS